MTYKLAIILFLVTIMGVTIGCSDESTLLPTDKRTENIASIELQLEELYTDIISPINKDLIAKITILKSNAALLSTNNTQQQLDIVKDNWISVATIWRKSELFNVGPVNSSFIHYKINRWPIDQERIDNYIINEEDIPINFVETIGSSSKGITALEYLLFETTFNFSQDDIKKIAYINSIILDIENNCIELDNIWESYKEEFTSSTEEGLTGSQNRIHNAISSLTEKIIISKLGKAIENIDHTPIDYLEAGYSENSMTFIKTNFEIIKQCFTSSNGFNAYLLKVDEAETVSDINTALDRCELQVNSFSGSLKNSIENKDTEKAEAIKESFNALLKIIKVDMAITLGNTITISDNDGD